MPQTTARQSRALLRRRVAQLVVAFDFIILLAPPLHWFFGNGEMLLALGYFIVSSVLVVLSLPLLAMLSTDADEGT